MATRKTYTREFKQDAVRLVTEQGYKKTEAARNLGQRILLDGGDSETEQIEFGFRIVLARPPSSKELNLLENAFKEYKRVFEYDLTGAERLIAVGESESLAALDPRELAAAATLANTLLNLDEAVTKE